MLFNSYEFIFIFLPVTLVLFFQLGRYSQRLAALWLAVASLFFYGWWNPAYLLLLSGSILFNYGAGLALAHHLDNPRRNSLVLFFGVAANLGLLAYFKYCNFFLDNLNSALGLHLPIGSIVLPLGISFFTFTQIAFLVDASRGLAKEFDFIHYTLFVTYFPHLIAGPVLHHKEMMPQFAHQETYRPNYGNFAVGLSLFFFGLFKKIMLADEVGGYARPLFEMAATGGVPSFKEAWAGALCYSLQIYFDFSGYSDMAIGLSRLFGVKLPLNFNSPYRAVNIIDFWRRWHMTLSRFLRDYLYIPLGGNRKGFLRRHVNLIITMVLGGLWHGAGWTFLIWGGLHGLYLTINHGWRGLRQKLGHDLGKSSWAGNLAGGFITFVAVVFAWVFFRATNLQAALTIVSSMLGLNGFSFTGHFRLSTILELLAIAWLMPNTQQIMASHAPALPSHVKEFKPAPKLLQWQPNWLWLAFTLALASASLMHDNEISEFLYFQF